MEMHTVTVIIRWPERIFLGGPRSVARKSKQTGSQVSGRCVKDQRGGNMTKSQMAVPASFDCTVRTVNMEGSCKGPILECLVKRLGA